VLKSLKRGRETLLTLLEAFVYDPLVDWAVGEDSTSLANLGTSSTATEKGSNHSKITSSNVCKQLERETISTRFNDMKSEWMQNR
jgi:serine/threonine-protein kinase SMG1